MTRHAKNCTAGAVYTYNEKKRDAQESGYGTNSLRIGKDSVKSFDCCSLTLQPCRNPVITKNGYLFDKEAILQYIISKKNEYSRKLKQYEKLKSAENLETTQALSKQQQARVENFINAEKPVAATPTRHAETPVSSSSSSTASSISNMSNGNEKKLPSFWIPSQCPSAAPVRAKKPDSTILCPVSGEPIKAKDLIDVKFTLVTDDKSGKSLIAKEARYMCPVTRDVLSNAVPCAVLRPTGDVVTLECVEKLIKKDWLHPLTSQKLSEKDIIIMQRGGTGYAITNENLQAKEKRPALQA